VTRGTPFKFVLGRRNVITGWDRGFATMRVGERAFLECGPVYAYGASGSPPKIPADATLRFEVELLGFGPKKKEVSRSAHRRYTEVRRVRHAASSHQPPSRCAAPRRAPRACGAPARYGSHGCGAALRAGQATSCWQS
jgi:FKBP-type peptidyl-prolyl cis-trans isomerase 2